MPKTAQPIELRRVTRFSINPSGSMQGGNSFASKPASIGLARHYEITLGVTGIPDPDTGYLVGIQDLDAVVRTALLQIIADRCEHAPTTEPGTMLPELWEVAQSETPHSLSLVRWTLSPYYWVEMNTATAANNAILIRQRFDFAAAHRLHTPTLSDQENAKFFGKCNNPSGHGHNYQIEPCVRIPPDALNGFDAQLAIQDAVNSTLIEALDHKFLNTDCDWFNQNKGGVIPSVENIARVCFEQLAPAIEAIGHGASLVRMSAWETEKTSAIYPG
jgi:6-pyruvoyltetrahydropterin/6-carboxytetrahydropterin synthase